MVAVTMPEPMCLVNQLRPSRHCSVDVIDACVCELCANISESPVQNRSNQSTFRCKISNESKRFNPFIKTLDHGIGVRIPASQPSSQTLSSQRFRSSSPFDFLLAVRTSESLFCAGFVRIVFISAAVLLKFLDNADSRGDSRGSTMETKKPSVPTAPTEIGSTDSATPDCEFQSRSHSRRGTARARRIYADRFSAPALTGAATITFLTPTPRYGSSVSLVPKLSAVLEHDINLPRRPGNSRSRQPRPAGLKHSKRARRPRLAIAADQR